MKTRMIARLDVKMEHLIKGVRMEGWRKMGNPVKRAVKYYEDGIDELIYMDVVASLYNRNNLSEIVRSVASQVFIPITVGGGVRSLDHVRDLLAVGADKVAINTAATMDPILLRRVSDTYGSQATVLSIEAQKQPDGTWEAMTDNGRNHTGRNAVKWAVEGAENGAGEILITSIDQDGTMRGMEKPLIDMVTRAVDIPVIACGGVGHVAHVVDLLKMTPVSAVAMAKVLHTDRFALTDLRTACHEAEIDVRDVARELENV